MTGEHAGRRRSGRRMFGKLLLIILAAVLTAATLLVMRQQRWETSHEMSLVHQRILAHERALWMIQTEIALRSRPEEVRCMMERLGGQWAAIPFPEDDPGSTGATNARYVYFCNEDVDRGR